MAPTEINRKAIAIWELLSKRGKLSVREVADYTKFQDPIIHAALGWLSKEGKVLMTDTNGTTYVELKQIPSDIYY